MSSAGGPPGTSEKLRRVRYLRQAPKQRTPNPQTPTERLLPPRQVASQTGIVHLGNPTVYWDLVALIATFGSRLLVAVGPYVSADHMRNCCVRSGLPITTTQGDAA